LAAKTMATTPRSVLMVCYHFPPVAEVGGIRPAKFAKYLPEFGWKPCVLTIRAGESISHDPSRLRDVSHVEIHRTGVWPTLPDLGVRVKRRLAHTFRGQAPAPAEPLAPPEKASRGEAISTASLVARIKRVLVSIFELPDPHIGWLFPAVWKGCQLVRANRVSTIYATAPPTTPTVVAYVLSLLTGLPLIFDLRDPWILHERKDPSVRTRLSDALDRWLERRLTVRAQAVVSATTHYTDHLRARYHWLPPDRFSTIPNGFDTTDFSCGSIKSTRNERLTMTYVGTFYLGRTPQQLLEALGRLIHQGSMDPEMIRVRLFGDVRHAEGIPVEEMIRANGLNGCVHVSNRVPYPEAIREIQEADVLLLFAPRQYFSIPGKAFEYLGAQKYILCLGQEVATADLVRTTGSGIVVDPYNVSEIAAVISKLYNTWKTTGTIRMQCDTRPFERRELTRQLACVLDRISGTSSNGRYSSVS